jgi:hypothetical protein
MQFTTFWSDLIAGALGGIIAAALFAPLFFLVKEKCFGIRDIAGKWYFEIMTETSAHKSHKGMVLRFVCILWRDGNTLKGTTEKIYERSVNGERDFFGADRTRGNIDGYYEKRYFSPSDLVTLHLTEEGHGRQSTYYFDLEVSKDLVPKGNFCSMVGDQEGTTTWQDKPF